MAKQYKDEIYMTGILLIIIVVTLYVLDYTQLRIENRYLPKTQGLSSKNLQDIGDSKKKVSPCKKEKILQFANDIAEQYPLEGVATVNISAELLDVDDYNKYLVEINAVGIDEYNNTSVYTYYIVIQEDSKQTLNMMPRGIECFKDALDKVKREIIVSMIKTLNNWGNNVNTF